MRIPFLKSKSLPHERKTELSQKAMAHSVFASLHYLGQPSWTQRDYTRLVKEGFERNPYVFQSIRLIAQAIGNLNWQIVDETGQNVQSHPLSSLWRYPSDDVDGASFLENLIASLLISGNGFIEGITSSNDLISLYQLRPDRLKLICDKAGWVQAYDYQVNGKTRNIPIPAQGFEPILHIKLIGPLDDHLGYSPLAAAAGSVDILNAALSWNKALLDNSATPSGALVYGANDQSHLTEEQFSRLKGELEEQYQGARNAGRPLLLEGGLDWKSMSLSPKDMDFLQAKNSAARDIALCFGVPPMLLGIPGDATYANYKEANRAFRRHTVLPLVSKISTAFTNWWQPLYPEISLKADLDNVEALNEDRTALWQRIGNASFLSDDEKREALGYPPLNTHQKPSLAQEGEGDA